MDVEPIRIKGLAEFNRNLKRINADLPKAVRLAGNEAAELVVGVAKSRVPRQSGAARRTVRAKSTRTAARVSGGSKRVPYYGWLDFGGVRRGRGGGAAKRPFIKRGRYIWAAYAENDQAVQRKLETALIEVARQAGMEVS